MPPRTKPATEAEAPTGDRKLYFIAGDSHVTGITPEPLGFFPTAEDDRPHAFVRQALGDHLIATDRDATGRARYAWE